MSNRDRRGDHAEARHVRRRRRRSSSGSPTDGTEVDIGDPLFVMETEKTQTEIEAEDAGDPCVRGPARLPGTDRQPHRLPRVDRCRGRAAARRPRRIADDDGRRPDCSTLARRRCCASDCSRTASGGEFGKGDMPGFVHTYVGAEAVAVGVCAHLTDADLITSTHRGHGHCLAKGVPIAPIIAELYGRETGLCKGRGGSMHVADFSKGMLGANAIVGGGISLAVGGALAAQTLADGRVAVSFFGDGASNQGIFHESLNLAAIWRLPVVFVCENNGWAESTPSSYAVSVEHIADASRRLRHPRRNGRRRRRRGRVGRRRRRRRTSPSWRRADAARGDASIASAATTSATRRPTAVARSVDRRATHDPIEAARERLAAWASTSPATHRCRARAVAELDAAFAAARAAHGPIPRRSNAMSSPVEPRPPDLVEKSFLEAVRDTLAACHARRPDRHRARRGHRRRRRSGPAAGGRDGRDVRRTKGLLEEFGPRRVRDTPISEAGFVGAASARRCPDCARSST